MAHTTDNKKDLILRLRRIKGQIEGIERALEREDGCATIMQAVAASRGALNAVMVELIEGHLMEHVVNPKLSASERAAAGKEILAVVERYLK